MKGGAQGRKSSKGIYTERDLGSLGGLWVKAKRGDKRGGGKGGEGPNMTDVVLQGLDEDSVRWLMHCDSRAPYLEGLEHAVQLRVEHEDSAAPCAIPLHRFYVEIPNSPCSLSNSYMLFVMERETPEYVLGSMVQDLPMSTFLGLGPVEEQRFHLQIRNGIIELRSSQMFERDMVFSKAVLNPTARMWQPQLVHFAVSKDDLLSVLHVFDMRSEPVCEERSRIPSVVQSMLKQTDLPLWYAFQMGTRNINSEVRKTVDVVTHRNQQSPFHYRMADKRSVISTNQANIESHKSIYVQRCMRNIHLSPKTMIFDVQRSSEASIVSSGYLTANTVGKESSRSSASGEKPPLLLELLGSTMNDSHEEEEGDLKKDTTCEHCDAHFERKYDKTRHVKSVHLRQKRYSCVQCEKKFFQSSHLRDHIKAVHEKKRESVCAVCGYSFATKYKLRRHVKSVHDRERPHQCDICSASYFQSSDLARHKSHRHEKEASRLSATDVAAKT